MTVVGPIVATASGTPPGEAGWEVEPLGVITIAYRRYDNTIAGAIDTEFIQVIATNRWHFALFSVPIPEGHVATKITIPMRWLSIVFTADPGNNFRLYTDFPTEKARQIGPEVTLKFVDSGGDEENGQFVIDGVVVTKDEGAALRLEFDSFPAVGGEDEPDFHDPPG